LNGKLNRTLNFTVAAAPPTPTVAPPTPVAKGGCPPLSSPALTPSGIISSVTMAEGTKGAEKEPVNPTTLFKPNSVFHAVVRIQNAPANTEVKAAWYATDVGDAAPCNTSIDSNELTAGGSRNIDFSLTPSTQWPEGTYRVEIFVNGTLDRVVNFSVK
jgi:hypothetical protein